MTAARPQEGSIVIVDWRGGRLPDEPGGIRPAVVVEDTALFTDGAYRNIIVVPLSTDARYARMAGFVEQIDPTPENGADVTCWAIAHHVTSVSLRRVIRSTPSRITAGQLATLRRKIAITVAADAAA